MDRTRPISKTRSIKLYAWVGAAAFLLIGGGIALAKIDFSSTRVDHTKISVEAVQQGTLEIKVSANGQLLPKNSEYIVSQVTARVAKASVKAGDVVTAGQLLVELSNPQLLDSADEAYSAWEGSVTELKASQAQLQTNLANQQIVLSQAQFNYEKARLQFEAETKLIGEHIIAEVDFKRSQLTMEEAKETRDIEAGRLNDMRGQHPARARR